jgi:hypothetical protein
MSYGLRVSNINGNAIVSDSTINPIFRGKATLVSQVWNPNPNYSNSGELDYQFLLVRQTWRIYINEPVIPFVACSPPYSYILYGIAAFSGYQDIYVYCDDPAANIAVYCFSSIPPGAVANTGYGMNIYGPSGQLRFSSALNNLAPVFATPVTSGYLSLRNGNFQQGERSYGFVGSSTATTAFPSGTAFAGRPAVFVPVSRTGRGSFNVQYANGPSYYGDIYYYLTSVDATRVYSFWYLGLRWEIADGSVGFPTGVSVASQTDYMMVIDTAHYD